MNERVARSVVVGCAGHYVAERDLIVVAVASADGAFREHGLIPEPPLRGGKVAAEAIAIVIGLELAHGRGYPSVIVMVMGQLTLTGRVVTRQRVPELDDSWNERLLAALGRFDRVSAVNTARDTTSPVQGAALTRCTELAAAAAAVVTGQPHVTGDRPVAQPGGVA